MSSTNRLQHPAAYYALGQGAPWRITSTTVVSGVDIYAIVCHNDTIFSTLTEPAKQGDSFVGVMIPAGTTLVGRFSAFTVSSGSPSILVSGHSV